MNKKPTFRTIVKILLISIATLNGFLLLYNYQTKFRIFQNSKILDQLKKRYANNSTRMFEMANFEYLISKTECSRNNSVPYFVTLVHSSPTQFQRRAACRDTWAHSDPRTVTYFLIGSISSPSLQKQIDQEDAHYNDIIQGNFFDSYHNLTYKHTMALKWFTENCPHVKYLLKLDDDVFVNVPSMHEFLVRNKNDKKFIMGIYFPPMRTCRDGKWKTSFDDIKEDFLPEYASGQSIIYSSDFVRDAYKQTLNTRFLWIDDLLISGYIRMKLNVRIEPIYPLRLSDDALQMILNGTNTTLPEPMFIVSEHNRKYDDVITLWNLTQPYRLNHQPVPGYGGK